MQSGRKQEMPAAAEDRWSQVHQPQLVVSAVAGVAGESKGCEVGARGTKSIPQGVCHSSGLQKKTPHER